MKKLTTPKEPWWERPDVVARRKKRGRRERRSRVVGATAIGSAMGMLGILIMTLIITGYSAFRQTMVELEFIIDVSYVSAENPVQGNYRAIVRESMQRLFPAIEDRGEQRLLFRIPTEFTEYMVRDAVMESPELVGQSLVLNVPVRDVFDRLRKGQINLALSAEERKISDLEIEWFRSLEQRGLISAPFNSGLLFNNDNTLPEMAGLWGAVVGSLFTLSICFLFAVPVGVVAAIYLEEFAPKNWLTQLIEININNLAAIPSIVYGLLGLAVFLGFFGITRSAPIAGGLVLGLMTLPTVIIMTRSALKAVPSTIREAALGVGASKQQMVWHHTLPIAMPGICTSVIIGLAQALGETAPLIMIGMNAFIPDTPDWITDPSAVLPTQIYTWWGDAQPGFVARTAAAILVLMMFLFLMNGTGVYFRQRSERKLR